MQPQSTVLWNITLEFVITRGNRPKILQTRKSVLHQMPGTIKIPVHPVVLVFPRFPVRNIGFCVMTLNLLSQSVAVVTFVRTQYFTRLPVNISQKFGCCRDIGNIAGAHFKMQRVATGVHRAYGFLRSGRHSSLQWLHHRHWLRHTYADAL